RARFELELRLAVERGHRDGRAERGVGHGQVDAAEDVVALAHEARVGPDVDADVDVARAPAEHARMPFPGDPDLLAVVDARGHLDLEAALLDRPPGALAVEARMLDDASRSAARRAGLRADELAERRAGHLLQAPATSAGRAADRLRAGLRAAAA